MEELPSFSDDGFGIGHMAGVILRVSREESKRLSHKLLTLLLDLPANKKRPQSKRLMPFKCKCVCYKNERKNLAGVNPEFLSALYQS